MDGNIFKTRASMSQLSADPSPPPNLTFAVVFASQLRKDCVGC
jgi:hypothetical protein